MQQPTVETWQNSGTASQILKHSTKILKKALAWSDSDACYCSSSQTSKLQQNMQWVTIIFPHQNIPRNQGLYSSTVQKINTCTNKTKQKKLISANPNIFQSKVTVQVKPTESSNDSITKLCSPQSVSHFATNKFRKVGVQCDYYLLYTVYTWSIPFSTNTRFNITLWPPPQYLRRHYLSQRAISSLLLGTASTTACMHLRIALYVYVYVCICVYIYI